MQSAAIDGGVMVTLRRLAALDRRPAGAGKLAAARLLCDALLVDDLELGPRLLRRALRWRTAHNALAELGPTSASRTLVIRAHHDAAPSRLVFHPAIARAAGGWPVG